VGLRGVRRIIKQMAELEAVQKNVNPLAVFALSPAGVSFENQEKGEKIILLLRAHLVTLIPALLITILLLVVPFLVGVLNNLLRINLPFSPGQFFLINIFWYLVIFSFVFYRFVFWYFNIYLVTNERIIDFDFLGILSKKISYTNLVQIEDVTPKTVGFAGTFFNFGDVFIQTAGERPEFDFENVARPDIVAEKIFEQVRLDEKEMRG